MSQFFSVTSAWGVADGLVSYRHQAISNHYADQESKDYESERSTSQLHQHIDELMQGRLKVLSLTDIPETPGKLQ